MVLESVLVLLAAAVAAVALCRVLKLPALVGYLATGLALGPHALRVASNAEETQSLAQFGVVFLMFSIGLEFSLAKLHAMRRVVFGLGGAQVLGSMALALVFFFQAEDGIRDLTVTGVQTCALPISTPCTARARRCPLRGRAGTRAARAAPSPSRRARRRARTRRAAPCR